MSQEIWNTHTQELQELSCQAQVATDMIQEIYYIDRQQCCRYGRVTRIILGNFPVFPFYHASAVNLTLLHSERPKLHAILVFLSAVGLNLLAGV